MLNTAEPLVSIVKTSGTHVAIFAVTFETATVIGKLVATIRKNFVTPAATIIETRVAIRGRDTIETITGVIPELTIDPPPAREAIIVLLPDDIFATDLP